MVDNEPGIKDLSEYKQLVYCKTCGATPGIPCRFFSTGYHQMRVERAVTMRVHDIEKAPIWSKRVIGVDYSKSLIREQRKYRTT